MTDRVSLTAGNWSSGEVASPPQTAAEQMARVFGFAKGLHATHLIDTGVRLGLLGAVAGHPDGIAPDDLASNLGLHPPYVGTWCDAACALEILDYGPSGYRMAPGMTEVLGDPDSPFYLGAFPAAHLLIADDYGRYPELFRSGGTNPYSAHGEAFLAAVAEATKVLPPMFAAGVLPQLPDVAAVLAAGGAVLDVGCGAGYAVIDLAERYPGVTCTGVDSDATSVAMARELVAARGLDKRVSLAVADASELPSEFNGQFDLATMFLVLHEVEPALKASVLASCHRALKPGGRLLIFDERYPSSPVELRSPTQVFAVMAQWYEVTWGNVFGTREEIRDQLSEAGFAIETEVDFSRFFVVLAEVA